MRNSSNSKVKREHFKVPPLFDNDINEEDYDLEAELRALTGEANKDKENILGIHDIIKIGMQQAHTDYLSDSADEMDVELLDELENIMGADGINSHVPASQPVVKNVHEASNSINTFIDSNIHDINNLIKLLTNRSKNYEEALVQANKINDISKSKRLQRGLTLLKNMNHEAQKKKNINNLSFSLDDIPPIVTMGKSMKAIENENPNLVSEPPISILSNNKDFNDQLVKTNQHNSNLINNTKNPTPSLIDLMDINVPVNNSANPDVVLKPQNIHNIEKKIILLSALQSEFKEQAFIAKQNNDLNLGRKFIHIYKEYQDVINQLAKYVEPSSTLIACNDQDIVKILDQAEKLPTLAQFISNLETIIDPIDGDQNVNFERNKYDILNDNNKDSNPDNKNELTDNAHINEPNSNDHFLAENEKKIHIDTTDANPIPVDDKHALIKDDHQLASHIPVVTKSQPHTDELQDFELAKPPASPINISPNHQPIKITNVPPITLNNNDFTIPALISQLTERMKVYETLQRTSQQAGDNPGKVRRMGRIVKQYTDAITACKKCTMNGAKLQALSQYPFQELPNPPNFPEIPYASYLSPSPRSQVPQSGATIPPIAPNQNLTLPNNTKTANIASPLVSPNASIAIAPKPVENIANAHSPTSHKLSVLTQNLKILKERQLAYKQAALIAKKQGNLTQAKEYLRLMKGFDPLLKACKSGLPIDMSGIPKMPSILNVSVNRSPTSNTNNRLSSGVISSSVKRLSDASNVNDNVNTPTSPLKDHIDGSQPHVFINEGKAVSEHIDSFHTKLKEQFNLCERQAKYYLQSGDISSARNFEAMAAKSLGDLERMREIVKRQGDVNFRFEQRVIPIVKSNMELGDNDMEITIVRGFQFDSTASKEIDTYVEFEFAFPNQTIPQKGKTIVVYGTNNPEYNQTFKLNIDRKSRSLARFFKRQHITFRVFAKGGLMRFINGDRLVGALNLKLFPFENDSCTIHSCLALMENRKETGKLEVIAKIRDPLHRKDIEETTKEWLIIL